MSKCNTHQPAADGQSINHTQSVTAFIALLNMLVVVSVCLFCFAHISVGLCTASVSHTIFYKNWFGTSPVTQGFYKDQGLFCRGYHILSKGLQLKSTRDLHLPHLFLLRMVQVALHPSLYDAGHFIVFTVPTYCKK